MALTRIDSYLVDLDSLGGITFDDQAGVPTFKVDAVSHRVGIGTTNPTSKLDIWGPQRTNALNPAVGGLRLAFDGGSNANEFGSAIVFTQRYDSIDTTQIGVGQISGVKISGGGSFGGGLTFSTSNGSSSAFAERLRITDTGNVGIGTTNPSQVLDVNGGIRARGSTSVYPDSGNAGFNIRAVTGSSQFLWFTEHAVVDKYLVGCPSGSNDLVFRTGAYDMSTGVERVRFTSSGNVGIGSTNPQAKLDVSGGILSTGITVSNGIRAATIGDYPNTNGELPNPAILVGTSGNYPLSFIGDGGSGSTSGGVVTSYYSSQTGWRRAIEIFNTTSATGNLLLMKTGGNVGIGITNPSSTLSIESAIPSISLNTTTDNGINTIIFNETGSNTARLSVSGDYLDSIIELENYSAGWASTGLIIRGNNVGIGSANPSVKFAVLGSNTVAKIESNTTYVDLQLANSQSSAGYIQYNLGDLRFFASSGSTPTMTISGGSPGNVGIGTTNPSTRLHLHTTAGWGGNITGSTLIRLESTDAVGPAIAFKNSSGSYWNIYHGSTSSFVGNNNLGFMYTDGVNEGGINNVRVTFASSGNVGIGTTNPVAKLDVIGTISTGISTRKVNIGGDDGRSIEIGIGNTSVSTYIDFHAADDVDGDYTARIERGGGINGGFGFVNKGTGSFSFFAGVTEQLTITTGGNVGIGTTNPKVKLQVQGGNLLVGNDISPTIGSSLGSIFLNGGGTRRGIHWSATSDTHYVKLESDVIDGLTINGYSGVAFATGSRSNSTWAERLRFDINGNVGIGITNPSTKLDVNGTVRAVNSTFAIRAVTTTSSQTSIGLTREGAPTDQRNWEILSGDGGHFVIRTINDSYSSAQDAFVAERGVSGVSIDNVRFLPGGAERLRITSTGNVGIGTTNPSKRLDVKIHDTSSGTRYVAHFGGNNHLTGYAVGIGLDPEGYGYRNKIGILAEGTSAGWSRGKLHFALNGISDTNEASIADAKMTILESGNVGIGTTNPGYKLHVVGDINYTGTLHNNGVPFSPVNIQEFTTSGTWTKPSGAKMVYVEVIGGGGGGTSGIKANAVESEGGAGGAGGMALTRWIPASTLGATVSVTVGAGGAGYPGRTVAMLPEDFDSALAGEGGSSSFGTVVIALGGAGAAGPYTTGAGAGSEGGQGRALYVNTVEGVYMGNAAGGSGITGAADNGRGGYSNAEGPGGGGAGGGMRADGFQRGGGTGGGGFVAYDATNWDSPFYHGGGGIAGAGGGGAGGIGATPGDGGGGGGASRLTSGGNGAVGTFPGGGGGGGGSTHTGASSGAGGAGANGVVRVYTYF